MVILSRSTQRSLFGLFCLLFPVFVACLTASGRSCSVFSRSSFVSALSFWCFAAAFCRFGAVFVLVYPVPPICRCEDRPTSPVDRAVPGGVLTVPLAVLLGPVGSRRPCAPGLTDGHQRDHFHLQSQQVHAHARDLSILKTNTKHIKNKYET